MEKVRKAEESTRISAALVLSTTLEDFEAIKSAAVDLGAHIVYQTVAPRFTRLYILREDERGREGP